ncbi:MAG: cardiolipin synthase [Desulfobulbaceae bacterium]|nr:MAG: cardiolipin synthase [Desulfobulbaceae bacterium]
MPPDQLHWSYHLFSTIFLLADLTIRIGLSVRVIMRRRPYPITLAWLVVILLVPFAGGFFYLLFGENRLSDKRTARILLSVPLYQHWLQTLHGRSPVQWQHLNPECSHLHQQAVALAGIPALDGNALELIDSPEVILKAIIDDIEQARSTCHLQFYIWEEGGMVDEVMAALGRANSRGVGCRLLLDAIGSRDFLRSKTAKTMRAAGIKIQESLPASIYSTLFARIDIRNHRKLVIIDGRIAYTGSQNMVDPSVFKQDAGVGKWIDLMVRIRGPVVEALAGTFVNDWFLDADIRHFRPKSVREDIDTVRRIADIHPSPPVGKIAVQLVPSGPGMAQDSIHSLLLATIYAARRELTLTTPYFIPDEPLLIALKAAAQRGVAVRIIVPAKNDSRLVEYASRARFEELVSAGVTILQFTGGLLHAKTITVDGDIALVGSVNLDMRSFWLNFEATLFIYDPAFTSTLRHLQHRYVNQSVPLDSRVLAERTRLERFRENLALLIGPLL